MSFTRAAGVGDDFYDVSDDLALTHYMTLDARRAFDD